MSSKTSSSVITCTTTSSSLSSSTHSEVISLSSSSCPSNQTNRAAGGQESVDDMKRLKALIDIMEEHTQKIYKSLLDLQMKRDHLVLLMNLIKHDKSLKDMQPIDREDVDSYMQIVERRLFSVDLFVSQSKHINSLSRLNELINSMISLDDLSKSHKYCELYLKAYRSQTKETEAAIKSVSNIFADIEADIEKTGEKDPYETLIQTEFKALLIGCTANDRENIRARLMAIMKHLEFQISKKVA